MALTGAPHVADAEACWWPDYAVDDATIALLLNWGPIISIPVCFGTSWLTAQTNGLRRVCVGSAVATGIFMVVRCLPSFRAGHVATIGPLSWWDYVCLHSAQIVNAAVGPPVMASPSLLSAQWFPDVRLLPLVSHICFIRVVILW